MMVILQKKYHRLEYTLKYWDVLKSTLHNYSIIEYS